MLGLQMWYSAQILMFGLLIWIQLVRRVQQAFYTHSFLGLFLCFETQVAIFNDLIALLMSIVMEENFWDLSDS